MSVRDTSHDEVVTFHDPSDLEGDIALPGKPSVTREGQLEYNTLDEPIKETILRDVKAIGTKFWHVLYPKEKKALLKEWDLWGPLILCTFLAMMLQESGSIDQVNEGGPEFAEVFVIVWIGSMVVTMNTKLLGGNISFFQSVCVLGYCLLPPVLSLVVCRILLLAHQTTMLFIMRFTITIIGFVWATIASVSFLGDSHPHGRRLLTVYPIFLFYFVISWLVISHSDV